MKVLEKLSNEAEEFIIDDLENLLFVTKEIKLSPNLPIFDDEFYSNKKEFWNKKIKKIKCVVAPMVDQSELAFRMMLRRYGADLCFTPMIHASLFVNDYTYRKNAFSTVLNDRPLIVQFCGNDSKLFLDACRLVEGFCDGVDLNLGCPQLIAKRGRYGAYLQEFPELIESMVQSVYKHCRLPISVKIRVSENLNDTICFAKMIEAAGASMLTVHGRVRDQRGVKTGLADWSQIRELKKLLKIPVIANGNIQLFSDIDKCLADTGADAVMSAEGILNNPCLFAASHLCVFQVAREYLEFAQLYKASVSAIRAHIFRICHYSLLKHNDLREKNSYVFSIDDFRKIVNELEFRCLKDEFEVKDNELSNVKNLLKLDDNLKHILNTLNSTSSENDISSNLLNLINSIPYWICKPYVRPLQRIHNQTSNSVIYADNKEMSNCEAGLSKYRLQRNAELSRICSETGLSRRQIRKRERRHVETQRKICCKPKYPKCERCQQPASQNCQSVLCKRCCKLKCIRVAVDCKMHGFNHDKMREKRVNYANKIGITLEELLERETLEEEKLKYLKNAKKPTLDLNAVKNNTDSVNICKTKDKCLNETKT